MSVMSDFSRSRSNSKDFLTAKPFSKTKPLIKERLSRSQSEENIHISESKNAPLDEDVDVNFDNNEDLLNQTESPHTYQGSSFLKKKFDEVEKAKKDSLVFTLGGGD